jgi:aspartyl-tRNA(Asn)/glutamyl-tRNA(Gln) amidotransferase subunit A
MADASLWRLDATALSACIAQGQVTPLQILEQVFERIERFEPALNMFTLVDRDGARKAAEAATGRQRQGRRLGPLDGIPISIKDNLFVSGLKACWGSLLFRDHVAPRDDIWVERLRAAGAIIVAKTTTPEFALSGHTTSRLTGTTRNPWNPALTPGGSSGGAVAAVAAGVMPLSIGTDAGGSIRMPAAYTGLIGFRPSNALIPRRYGFPPMAVDFQIIGPTCRTMRDLDLLMAVLVGPDPGDPASIRFPAPPAAGPFRRYRLGWLTAIGDEVCDAEVEASIAQAVEILKGLGCDVEPARAPFDLASLRELWGTLTAAGAARVAARFPDRWRTETTDSIRATVERGLSLTATAYAEALDKLATFRADVSVNWGPYDALIMPTAPAPAWPVEQDHPTTIGKRPGSAAGQAMFCGWINAVGYSAISVPTARHPDGRPIGMQIVAPFGSDPIVLEVARRFEQARPWDQRWPTLANQG